VLAFPSDAADPDPEERYLGDVVVSLDRARAEARLGGMATARRLERLIAHGVLHLLGYDDRDDDGERRMEEREDRYLTLTG
jgi:probable rRNA maturation factor